MLVPKGDQRRKINRAVEKTRDVWIRHVSSLFRNAKFDQSFWEGVEESLIAADVGVRATEELLNRLGQTIQTQQISDSKQALMALKDEMVKLLDTNHQQRELTIPDGLLVLVVVGVNGAGKTTSIAKLANMYQRKGKRVLLGAADTFRAAAIDQLKIWGHQLNIDVIAHQPGGDPGSVAFDTISAAEARSMDVAIIDTAGRLHSNTNLIDELRKILRVIDKKSPNATKRVLLILDATTGQNGLQQAISFTETIDCAGAILAKLDGSSKGGMVISISTELNLPCLFIGSGEGLNDLEPFDSKAFIDSLFDG